MLEKVEYGKLINGDVVRYDASKLEKDGYIVFNPSENTLNQNGIYRIEKIEDNGENILEGNIIKEYIGLPNIENDNNGRSLMSSFDLSDVSELAEALERIIAQSGVTEEDREMAKSRIAMREEIENFNKNSFDNPYKYWVENKAVIEGEWWQCFNDEGKVLMAIKTGIPSSDEDNEYWNYEQVI